MAPEKDDSTGSTGPARKRLAMRRRPELSRFLVVGGLIGFALGVYVSFRGPQAQGSTALQQFILLGAIGALFASFFAAIIYLVLDRLSLRD